MLMDMWGEGRMTFCCMLSTSVSIVLVYLSFIENWHETWEGVEKRKNCALYRHHVISQMLGSESKSNIVGNQPPNRPQG